MPTELFDDGRTKKDGSPKRKPGRPPGDRKQRLAIEKIGRMAGDVERLIDDQIRLCEWTQGAVRHELTSRDAAKQEFVHPTDIAKLAALTKMINEMVGAKSKFSHLAKFLGAGLTPDEVLEGACQRILRQDTKTRGRLIDRLIAGHNEKLRDGQFPLKRPPQSDAQPEEAGTPSQTSESPLPVARPETALDAIASLAS